MVDAGGFADVDPRDPRTMVALRAYAAELVDVGVITEDGLGRIDLDPDEFSPPNGALIALVWHGRFVAIGGVRMLQDSSAELKRMWVDAAFRGSGAGRRLLSQLEVRAAQLGASRIVLDTSSLLSAAVHLYRSAGYVEIEPYNDNPDCSHWFGKPIVSEGSSGFI